MVGDKRQKGFVAAALLVGLFIVLATVAVAYYFGRKAVLGPAQGPVEPPQAEINFQKSFNIIVFMASEGNILAAKKLGANMVTIFYAAAIGREDEFPAKNMVARAIAAAHKNGLQVEIRNSFAAESEAIVDLEEYKNRMVDFAVDLAKFAQKHQVYRLAPFSEIDNNLFNHEGEVTETAQTILNQVRQHYHGQVGVGMAAPWRGPDYNFAGFDYISVSIYVQEQTSIDDYLQAKSDINLESVLSRARRIAQKSGIRTLIIGETGVFNPGEERLTAFKTKILTKDEEADYYRRFLEKTNNLVEGYAFNLPGYLGIQGDPAEEVVRQWYSRL